MNTPVTQILNSLGGFGWFEVVDKGVCCLSIMDHVEGAGAMQWSFGLTARLKTGCESHILLKVSCLNPFDCSAVK